MGAERYSTWEVILTPEFREAFDRDDREAQQHAAEQHAIDSLAAAYKAMKEAAGEDVVKQLYAEEIMDILRRIRGGHDKP